MTSNVAARDTAAPHPARDPWDGVADRIRAHLSAPGGDGHVVLPGLLGDVLPTEETPQSWREAGTGSAFDRALRGLGAALGPAMTWRNQQAGRVVHNMLPSRGQESSQTGAGSTSELLLHTEDAFHPQRARLVVLACVRNTARIGTYVAGVRRVRLDPADWAQLERPAVRILPDDSYGDPGTFTAGTAPGVATTWAGPAGRCLRFDPAYSVLPDDDAFTGAYRRLTAGLLAAREEAVLAPGDVIVLDNDAVVHGRAAFTPRFDGSDRWLKRLLIRAPGERPAGEAAETGYGQTPIVADGERVG
ncbi:TauD/TfdA family dioxygenase [Actinoplanes sp. NPDC051851]|uniref:TauD/TfdA family dioxygenase n=1 Tax=Actinoplanes sp. NPDC051851 TaxID=3154753 RepID=UPI00342FE704